MVQTGNQRQATILRVPKPETPTKPSGQFTIIHKAEVRKRPSFGELVAPPCDLPRIIGPTVPSGLPSSPRRPQQLDHGVSKAPACGRPNPRVGLGFPAKGGWLKESDRPWDGANRGDPLKETWILLSRRTPVLISTGPFLRFLRFWQHEPAQFPRFPKGDRGIPPPFPTGHWACELAFSGCQSPLMVRRKPTQLPRCNRGYSLSAYQSSGTSKYTGHPPPKKKHHKYCEASFQQSWNRTGRLLKIISNRPQGCTSAIRKGSLTGSSKTTQRNQFADGPTA